MSDLTIYSHEANQIAGLLFVAALASLGGYRALHTAWVVRRTDPMSAKHITQRNRYFMVLVGLLCMAPTAYVFIRFGAGDVLQVMNILTDGAGLFGWALTISAIAAIFYVPIAVIASFCIMLWPSPFAYRKAGLYKPTVFHRDNTPGMVPWIRGFNTYTDRFGRAQTGVTGGNADHYDVVTLSPLDFREDVPGTLSPERLAALHHANPMMDAAALGTALRLADMDMETAKLLGY
jgi:hypothetical protein